MQIQIFYGTFSEWIYRFDHQKLWIHPNSYCFECWNYSSSSQGRRETSLLLRFLLDRSFNSNAFRGYCFDECVDFRLTVSSMTAKSSNCGYLSRFCPSCDSFWVNSENFCNFRRGEKNLLISCAVNAHSPICPFRTLWAESIVGIDIKDKAHIACSKAATFRQRVTRASYP
jgi:hypothetical protein